MDNDFVFDIEDGRCEIDTYLFFREEWSAMQSAYAVLDLEVTDLFERQGEIMGIHAMQVSPDGAVLSELHLLVQTQRPAPDWLLEDLKMDRKTLAQGGIEAGVAMRRLAAFLGQHTIFIHHSIFDLQFLEQCGMEHGAPISNPVFDTMAIAELTWPGQRLSQSGLREYLRLGCDGADPWEVDVRITLAILLAAREVAHAVHVRLIHAARTTQNSREAKSFETAHCPFCQVRHSFGP